MNIIYKFDKALSKKKPGFFDIVIKNSKIVNGKIQITFTEEVKKKYILSYV